MGAVESIGLFVRLRVLLVGASESVSTRCDEDCSSAVVFGVLVAGAVEGTGRWGIGC